MNGKRVPDFIAKSVRELGKTNDGKDLSRWTDIGVAFLNSKSESITIKLNALPLGDKIILTKPLPHKDGNEYNPFNEVKQ